MEKTISQKIIELRKAAGLTQEKLGEKLGISGQAVSKWERGEAMPDILILPDLCDVLGTTLDSLLGGKRAESPESPQIIGDFCEFAMKNGRAETVRQAISRMMNRDVVVSRNDELSICLENGENILVSNPLGMGFVMSGTDFADYCMKMDRTRINNLISLFTDKTVFAVIKTIAKNTATVDEICAETGLEKSEIQEILLELSNFAVIVHGRDKNGKEGYCPASGMIAVWMVLAGCSLFDLGGVRGSSWVSV